MRQYEIVTRPGRGIASMIDTSGKAGVKRRLPMTTKIAIPQISRRAVALYQVGFSKPLVAKAGLGGFGDLATDVAQAAADSAAAQVAAQKKAEADRAVATASGAAALIALGQQLYAAQQLSVANAKAARSAKRVAAAQVAQAAADAEAARLRAQAPSVTVTASGMSTTNKILIGAGATVGVLGIAALIFRR